MAKSMSGSEAAVNHKQSPPPLPTPARQTCHGGSSYLEAILLCVCVFPWLNCRKTMTGRKQAGGEWGVRALRVCIQALINSAASSLTGMPAFSEHMPVTRCVHLWLCVCASVVMSLSAAFVPTPLPSARLARLPSGVSFCEAHQSHRMERNYPLLTLNPGPPKTRAFSHCIHKQTSSSSPIATHSL